MCVRVCVCVWYVLVKNLCLVLQQKKRYCKNIFKVFLFTLPSFIHLEWIIPNRLAVFLPLLYLYHSLVFSCLIALPSISSTNIKYTHPQPHASSHLLWPPQSQQCECYPGFAGDVTGTTLHNRTASGNRVWMETHLRDVRVLLLLPLGHGWLGRS